MARRVSLGFALSIFLSSLAPAATVDPPSDSDTPKEPAVTHRAAGTFDVTLTPQTPADGAEAPSWGRMAIAKTFHGDLEATSRGEMLTAMTEVKGSAGYVAVEKVDGTLGGRRGSFFLQHSGLMDRGSPSLVITVVPDSGNGELAGIEGTMTIEITEGKHFYAFEYRLRDVAP
ncbi:MAG: hypothetical protein AMXMBFR36_05730 [Acidobacteriota bacterium]